MPKIDIKQYDSLFEAILKLETLDECRDFFEDLCTIKELQDLSQRFDVALMLSKGMNYVEISEKTGASTATISRVNRSLTYGCNGYKAVFDKK